MIALDSDSPLIESIASEGHADVVGSARAAEGALLESAELSELMSFSDFQRCFEGKLREWSGFPNQIKLGDGRKIKLIAFDFDKHDDSKIYPAFREDNFWAHPLDFFNSKRFPNGVVIGVYRNGGKQCRIEGLPQKKIVMIP